MKSTRAGFRRNYINYSCGIIKQSCRSRTSNELTRNDQQRQSKFTSQRCVHVTRSHLPLISPFGGIPRSGERTFSISSPYAEPSRAKRRKATSIRKAFRMSPMLRFQFSLLEDKVSFLFCVISNAKISFLRSKFVKLAPRLPFGPYRPPFRIVNILQIVIYLTTILTTINRQQKSVPTSKNLQKVRHPASIDLRQHFCFPF